MKGHKFLLRREAAEKESCAGAKNLRYGPEWPAGNTTGKLERIYKAGDSNPETSGKADDDKRKSLSSAGCGFQFNLPEHGLSTRLDIGWPMDHKVGTDGDHTHVWYRVTKTY